MKLLLFSILLILFIYTVLYNRSKINSIGIMSRIHTNYAKGVAVLLVIFSHLGGKIGVRYFTPLGGIGVAIFLIITGFGLNESFYEKIWKTIGIRR